MLKDFMLRLSHESTRRSRWIRCRKQRPASEPDREINDVCHHRWIKQEGWPELPSRNAPPLSYDGTTSAIGSELRGQPHQEKDSSSDQQQPDGQRPIGQESTVHEW